MLRHPIPMTPGGLKKLQEELKQLKSVERPRIVADIEAALAMGDLAENAEYHAAKERQGLLQRKIAELENKIAQAHVIDPALLDHQKVVFGATVRLTATDSGEEVCYRIVGADESDVKERKISVESPVAKALIGRSVGDVVRVISPRGDREFEILEIKYA